MEVDARAGARENLTLTLQTMHFKTENVDVKSNISPHGGVRIGTNIASSDNGLKLREGTTSAEVEGGLEEELLGEDQGECGGGMVGKKMRSDDERRYIDVIASLETRNGELLSDNTSMQDEINLMKARLRETIGDAAVDKAIQEPLANSPSNPQSIDDEHDPHTQTREVVNRVNATDVDDADYAAAEEGRVGVAMTDSEYDKKEHAKLTDIIKNRTQFYSWEEEKAIRAGYELFEKCKDKCKDKKNFEELKSPDEKVKMVMMQVDGHSAGLATTVVDASAEVCAAYEFSSIYSKEWYRTKEELGVTEFETKRQNDHSLFYMSTRDIGVHGFAPRTARFKVIWKKEDGGRIIINASDTDDLKDKYPLRKGNVLVSGNSVWVFEPLAAVGGVPRTVVTLSANVDAGGILHNPFVDKMTDATHKAMTGYLSVVSTMRKKFDNSGGVFKSDDELDQEELNKIADDIKNVPQLYRTDEERTVLRGKEFYKKCNENKHFDFISLPDKRITAKMVHNDGDSLVTGVVSTVVDANVEECTAYKFYCDSRASRKRMKKRGEISRTIKAINPHALFYLSRINIGVRGFNHREFRQKLIWRRDSDGKCFIFVTDTEILNDEYPREPGDVVASAYTVWTFESLDPIGDVPQTAATMTSRIDVKGAVPSSIMNRLAKNFGGDAMAELRNYFDKSRKIEEADVAIRLKIAREAEKLVAKPNEATTESLKLLFDIYQESSQADKGGIGWGKSTAYLRTGFGEAAAFFWNVERLSAIDSNKNVEKFVEERNKEGFEMQVRITEEKESKLGFVVTKAQHEFFSKMRMFKADENTIIITTSPIKGKATTTETTVVKICKGGYKKTKVELATKIELRGEVSKVATKRCVKKRLGLTIDAEYYFDNLIESGEANEEDGKAFGKQLMLKLKEKGLPGSKQEVVKAFIQANRALRELVEERKFIEGLLCAVIWNRLRRSKGKEGIAGCMEEEEGREIGSRLAMTMATTLTAKHAVDEWSKQFSIVVNIMEEHVWLRPMLETIARELMVKSLWGMKARVIAGAVTSLLDFATDVYVTYSFLGVAGKEGYFQASLASLNVSMGLQLIFVWGQNKDIGWRKVLRESIPVLIGFKPALDAYRVATGVEQEKGQRLTPMTEMTAMKVTEVFAEGIPGVIIQLMAIATSVEDVGVSSWLSVAVSAFTVGFASASISYDWDTDPEKRQAVPGFYGFVPAAAMKRALLFASMLVISTGILIIRCMSIVLLGLIGRRWAFGFIGADLGLYLIVKVLRGDFWYWAPTGGFEEIFVSALSRILTKTVTDFTSLVFLRHPQELGGLGWLLSLAFTMVYLPVAIEIYEWKNGMESIADNLAWKVVWFVIPTVLVSFAVFFCIIEKKFLGTFFSLQTGKKFAQDLFKKGVGDAAKAAILKKTRHYWVGIEDDIKLWVRENWGKWEKERPEWLTEAKKAEIPIEWIPTCKGRNRETVRRASLRRGSVLKTMAGKLNKVTPELSISITDPGYESSSSDD